MCSFAPIHQNRLLPPFTPSMESSFSLGEDKGSCEHPALAALVQKNGMQGPPSPFERGNALSQNKEIMQQNGKVFPEMSLGLYMDYLKKRIKETSSNPVSTRKLFKEITGKGYRGTIGEMQRCVLMIRKNNRPPEESFQFHKEYIKRRIEEARSEYVSARQLFEEIRANGYLGAYGTVVTFVSIIRERKNPEASLQFHKEYIKKRIEEAAPESVSLKELFTEIKAKGYQGKFRTIQTFASMIRGSRPPEGSLQFHKEHIRKRVGEAASGSVSTKELFEEIKAKGYQGTLRTVQTFASMIRTIRAPEASLAFHKEYIRKRIGEAASGSVSIKQLFEEIKTNGYLGAYSTLVTHISIVRKKQNKRPEASLQFHKEYIRKRLETAASESVLPRQLFEEVKANGYLGSHSTVKAFVSTIREKKNKKPEESLQFHKKYITKRLEEVAPESVSAKELFEEIIIRGYRGTLRTMQIFLSTIRTSRAPEASLQLYKGYIKKRVEEAAPESIPTTQLFREIKANGYLGAYSTLVTHISIVRKKKNKSPEESLQFHKEYITKRLEEVAPEFISAKELFEEIIIRGYRGTLRTMQLFLSTIRTSRAPEASLQLYKGYIKKRVEEAAPESIPTTQLFEEIKANGYLGSHSTVKAFVWTIRTSKPPAGSLAFHKEYIKKRLEQAASESVSSRQLFEEIKTNGYLGSYNMLAGFVSTIRIKSPAASLAFHKEYIKKRIEEAAPASIPTK